MGYNLCVGCDRMLVPDSRDPVCLDCARRKNTVESVEDRKRLTVCLRCGQKQRAQKTIYCKRCLAFVSQYYHKYTEQEARRRARLLRKALGSTKARRLGDELKWLNPEPRPQQEPLLVPSQKEDTVADAFPIVREEEPETVPIPSPTPPADLVEGLLARLTEIEKRLTAIEGS